METSFRGVVARAMGPIVAAVMLTASASAGLPIIMTHEGQGSGTLDGVPFGVGAPVDFIITANGDIGDRGNFGGGWWIDHTSASIAIDGLGTFDFLVGTRTFVNNGANIVGFSRGGSGGSDLFNGPVDGAFGAWDMTTSIGPISGTGNLLQWGGGDILTSGGVLIFDNGSGPATFTATVIPAPAVLTLLAMGGLVARRRRRTA